MPWSLRSLVDWVMPFRPAGAVNPADDVTAPPDDVALEADLDKDALRKVRFSTARWQHRLSALKKWMIQRQLLQHLWWSRRHASEVLPSRPVEMQTMLPAGQRGSTTALFSTLSPSPPTTLPPQAETGHVGEVCFLTESPFRILRAAESGNVDDFARLWLEDPNRLSVQDSRGRTAAHQAAARNQVKILQFISARGGDLNIKDNKGNTPLHVAIEEKALDAVEYLLKSGASTSILNDKHQAPIHLATELNRVEVLKTMGRYQDRVDASLGGEHGRTALHIAAIHDHDECARVLVEHFSACARQPCANGYYPIHEAAKNASSRTMEVILQWGESQGCYTREEMISLFDAEGNVPLHSAVHGGDIRAVELCLRSGARISTQQHDLSTPVHLACAQGAADIVELMFNLQPAEKARCLRSCDAQRMTPMHCAAMFDHPEIVDFLVREGADIDPLDKERRSPLLLAASRSAWRTVNVLIRIGANMHLADSNSRNVLHLLVMNGGRLDEFAAAVANKKHALDRLLNEKDATGCSPMHYASREGHIRSLENLIRLGACINLKNNNNESPLHFAARYGRYNTVRQLLDSEKGTFIINEGDGEGLTPLHIASQQGHTRVVQLLLNRGALLHRDHNGRTPLHLAAMSGFTHTMELLQSVHSHLLDQVDKDGNTALHLATMENKPNSISLLLSMNCQLLYNLKDMSAIDYAIYYKYPDAALAMVTHDERAQEVLELKSDKYPCVTLALIASMPRVFESVQDKCIVKANCKKDSKSFYIKYNFGCLSRPTRVQPELRTIDARNGLLATSKTEPLPALNIKYNFRPYEISADKLAARRQQYADPKWRPPPLLIINAMVVHGRVELLAHPLSQKYLQMKWHSYGKYFHLTNLLLYSIFLLFVTTFSASLMDYLCSLETNCIRGGPHQADIFFEENISGFNGSPVMYVCSLVILIYVAFNALREIYQLYQQRFTYMADPSNLVTWLLYCSAAATVVPLFCGHLEPLQISTASATVFLAWFNLLLFLQRFDRVGIYVVMFLEILQTLIKVLLIFSILIIAFGLAFYILLSQGNHLPFRTVHMSLLRTFSMMLGEIDVLGTFVQPFYRAGSESLTLPYPLPAFIILGVFMVVMPILLMNLLIGLAVGDIESVRRNAQLKRLAMQVVLHTELERKLPHFLLERVDRIELIEFPNDNKCGKLGFLDTLLRKWFYNPFTDDGNDIPQETSEDFLAEELLKAKQRLKEMSASLEAQHQLLRLVVQKMEIKTEADDVDEGASLKPTGAVCRWKAPRLRNRLRAARAFKKSPSV